MELFGEGLPLPEFPCLPAVKGLGLSDQVSYAGTLAGKFDYTNTFYDREPRIDITATNKKTAYGAARSAKMNFREADANDPATLNRILYGDYAARRGHACTPSC